MWKCFDPELERQIRCFPYGERSDVPRLQQDEQKAVGRQRDLGLNSKQKEIIQNVMERKDSMAVLPRPLALERACVTFSPLSFWTT